MGTPPLRQRLKAPLSPGIPAYPHSARKRQDRPVTPEVAGSSPVAPAENILQIHIFCCLHRRKRPPVSPHPALIPHETENSGFAGIFFSADDHGRLSSRTRICCGRHRGSRKSLRSCPTGSSVK